MGAGKSTVGREVAPVLGLRFVDLDDELQARRGLPAGELLTTMGEATFRLAEVEVLADVLSRGPAVVALGGGTLEGPGAWELVDAWGTAIFLDAPIAVLAERVGRAEGRPLWRGDVADRLQRRRASYGRAAHRVDAARALPEVVTDVIGVWRSYA